MSRRPRSPAELLLAVQVFFFAIATPLVARLDLARLQTVLEPRRKRAPGDPAQISALAERIDWVLIRGRPLVRPGCLTRGLTLFYFLRRAGADVQLAFGMGNRQGGEYFGHCWLVKDGEPFLERTDPRPLFAEIVSIPRV